jgi:outer membrane protein assembly factor BamB
MASAPTAPSTPRRHLRLWPGVVAAALLVLLRFVLPLVAPEAPIFGLPAKFFGVLAGLVLSVVIVLWWLFFSRAAWSDRLGALVLMVAALVGTRLLVHESIAGGLMGNLFFVYALPLLGLVFVAWAVVAGRLPAAPRRASMAAAILLACGTWTLVRTAGITGSVDSDFEWRWAETPEERLLAEAGDALTTLPPAPALAAAPSPPRATVTPEEPTPAPPAGPSGSPPATALAVETAAEWPGFRGPRRDGVVRGVRIDTDWAASPPVELWRRPIGPAWSSFAVRGDRLYTQEQRGDDEVVACYDLHTGEPVWGHRDAARFYESNGGAGPRGTPTLSGGRLYTLGATGIVNALDAADGSLVWSRNVASDTETEVPGWGFSSSPLVVGDVVVVAAAGKLAAYDIATGWPRWFGPEAGVGYSSPHLLTLDGVTQIVLLNGAGAVSVAPDDGKVLWEHELPSGARIVQPAMTADGDVLVNDGDYGDGNHLRRLAVARGPSGWKSEERWSSRGLKPDFNDFVVHDGHAFGFDGSILSCVDLADGKRKWKGGRYGNGQLVLLADQDVLLVLSEQGELALVSATPGQFSELARFPAIQGKTWNHPVLVGDVLLVRNGEEMAAFRLSLAGG